MTLNMVRRTAGPAEQQTLLPFFSKHQSAPSQSSLLHHDGNPAPCTDQRDSTQQTTGALPEGAHTIMSEPIVPPSTSNSIPVSQSIHSPQRYGQTRDPEESDGHRRKRCKISDSVESNSLALGSLTSDKTKGTMDLCNATADSPKIDPAAETQAGPSKELAERKIVRLRLDSKHLTSFPLGDTSDEAQNRPLTRRKSARLNTIAKFVNRVKIAKMSYSVDDDKSSTQGIGRAIENIMDGRIRYPEYKRLNTRPVNTRPVSQPHKEDTRPTHPFFLPKNQPSNVPSQPSSSDTLCASLEPVSLREGTRQSGNLPTPASRIFPPISRPPSTFPSTLQRQKFRREGEPVDPIWPPRDMVHVRDCFYPLNSPPTRPLEQRKAKQSTSHVTDTENVLSNFLMRFVEPVSRSPKRQRSKALRRPRRHVVRCEDFQTAVLERINVRNPTQDNNQFTTLPRSSHPALVKLASFLQTSTSSFDRGEYDDTPWSQRYTPKNAAEVLQVGPETSILRTWLQHHEVTAVNTSLDTASPRQTPDSKTTRKKKRKKPKDLDDFIVSSGDEDSVMDELQNSDEDELSGSVTVHTKRSIVRSNDFASSAPSSKRPTANTILLSGPSGCGKTAAVYAVASELGFEVFEVNAGARRSARDIIERVGDMTQNHLVQLLSKTDGELGQAAPGASTPTDELGPKQKSMVSFFAKKAESKPKSTNTPGAAILEPPKPRQSQKQSLILLEEVDVLFSEDKQFWSGVLALIEQSKRPIVMTCNDESLLPLETLALHAVLRLKPAPGDLAADYLLLLCANEGHLLDRKAILDLYIALNKDLRATIMQLNFWCQMGVGSRKSGLDWMVGEETSDTEDSNLRTASCDTYMEGMGWYSADIVVGDLDPLEHRLALLTEGIDQWEVGLADWLEMGDGRINGGCFGPSDTLEQIFLAADVRSCLDLFSVEGYDDNKHSLDPSLPPIPERQRLDYVEGYQLVQTDLQTEFNQLSLKIAATLSIITEMMLSPNALVGQQDDITGRALQRSAIKGQKRVSKATFQDAFQAIIDPPEYSMTASGLRPLSFDHGTAVIAEDVAPYIRHIVSFESHLEHYRSQLGSLTPPDGAANKRPRTTRASRAAAEGGDKASMRRERWFPGKVSFEQVMATGGKGWDAILQYPPVLDHSLEELRPFLTQNGRLLRPAPPPGS